MTESKDEKNAEPLKGATECSPGRKPRDKENKRYIKAPEGRKKLNLNFLRPSGALSSLLNLSPRLTSWATLLRPFQGLAGHALRSIPFILHPSSFILHPSSFRFHPSAFILAFRARRRNNVPRTFSSQRGRFPPPPWRVACRAGECRRWLSSGRDPVEGSSAIAPPRRVRR